MTDKGKSPIGQVVRSAWEQMATEEWLLDIWRADIERMESAPAFVKRVGVDYATVRDVGLAGVTVESLTNGRVM